MTAQCEYTYLLPVGAVQCANEAEYAVQGSFFCDSHVRVARQSVLDDEAGETERDTAAADAYDRGEWS